MDKTRSDHSTWLSLLLASAAGAAGLLAAGGAAAQSTDATAARPAATELEGVVVTASRRESSLREIPSAVSAYAGDRLQAAHIETLVDLAPSSPNIQIGALATNANITIRGIGNDLTTAGSDPGVAFHMDGVYLAETGLATSAFLDLARVEVLRGPQGTLFGRNATGGAVNLIPNIPTRDPAAGVDASFGVAPFNDHLSGFVSGPLDADGKLLGRLAAQQTYNRGFTENLAADGPRRLDDTNDYSVRGQLLWAPVEDFSARLSLEYQREHDHGPGVYQIGVPDPTIPLPGPILGQPVGDQDDRKTYANQGQKRFEGFGATLVTDWRILGGDLKGTFAFNNANQFTNAEGDGTPAAFTNTFYRQHVSQEFAELIYASPTDSPFTYILGANYFREHEFQNVDVPISLLPLPVDLGGTLGTQSYAAFGHAQYAIATRLKLFAGLRVTHDRKRIDEFNNFVGTDAQRASWTRTTYEVGASYDVARAVTGYVKYATGYKGGGFSAGALTPAFNPETDKLVEAGLKGSYFGGALQANLAAFHTSYNDLQVAQVQGVISQVTNAAQASVKGIELETVERLSRDLRLELSGGYLDAQFDRFDTADSARPGLGLLHLAGNSLPLAPHYTGHAAVYYDVPIAAPGKLTADAQYDWKSRVFFSEFNLPVASQKPVGKLNLHLNYESEDQRWAVGLYGRNVTNEAVRTSVIVVSALLGSLSLAELEPGREVGVSFHYRH